MTISELRDLLQQRVHVSEVKHLANEIAKSKENVDLLMRVFLENEGLAARYASWVLQHVCDINPQLADPYQKKLLELLRVEAHASVHRCALRALELIEIKEELVPEAIEIGFNYLIDVSQPIAMKVYSMGLLFNCCKPYPELLAELKMHIEEQLPRQSPGFKSKAKKVLAGIAKQTKAIKKY